MSELTVTDRREEMEMETRRCNRTSPESTFTTILDFNVIRCQCPVQRDPPFSLYDDRIEGMRGEGEEEEDSKREEERVQ